MSSFASLNWNLNADTLISLWLDAIERALDAQDFDTAIVEAEELLDTHPNHPEALSLLVQATMEIGEFEAAHDIIEQVISLSGPDTTNLMMLTVCSFETCDFAGGLAASEAALAINPHLPEAHFFRGLSLEPLGRNEEANRAFSKAHEIDPDRFSAPLAISKSQWSEWVDQALAAVSPFVRDFWALVPLELHEIPSVDELRTSSPPITPSVSGLYIGTPPREPGSADRPSALRLYTRNLARCGTPQGIIHRIAQTLYLEACDWLHLETTDTRDHSHSMVAGGFEEIS